MPPKSNYPKYFRMRRENKPVKTIFKRHNQAKKRPTKTDTNKQAIVTLSKQVKSLQLNRYGDRQYMYQVAKMDPTFGPQLKSPVFFCASSFFNNEPLYRGVVDPTTLNASYQIIGNTPATQVMFKKPTFDVDINQNYQWVEQQANKTSISRIEYLPLYMNHKITFQGNMQSTDAPVRYRITMFKTKRQPLPSNVKNFSLPAAAGAYWYMCSDDYAQRNRFSKSYHQVISDKWVVLNPPNQHTDAQSQLEGNRKSVRKTLNMNYTFKTNKPYKPNIGATPASQNFWTNVEEDHIIWFMISSNIQQGSVAKEPSIQIERSLGWRDNQGTTPNQGP